VYDGIKKVKKDVECRHLLRMRPAFSHSVMASVGISALGRTIVQFVYAGVKAKGDYYRNVLLRQALQLPDTVNFVRISVVYVSQGSAAAYVTYVGMST